MKKEYEYSEYIIKKKKARDFGLFIFLLLTPMMIAISLICAENINDLLVVFIADIKILITIVVACLLVYILGIIEASELKHIKVIITDSTVTYIKKKKQQTIDFENITKVYFTNRSLTVESEDKNITIPWGMENGHEIIYYIKNKIDELEKQNVYDEKEIIQEYSNWMSFEGSLQISKYRIKERLLCYYVMMITSGIVFFAEFENTDIAVLVCAGIGIINADMMIYIKFINIFRLRKRLVFDIVLDKDKVFTDKERKSSNRTIIISAVLSVLLITVVKIMCYY